MLFLKNHWQLRYANRRWGAPLTDIGRRWLDARGMAHPPGCGGGGRGVHMPAPQPGSLGFPNPWAATPMGMAMPGIPLQVQTLQRPVFGSGSIVPSSRSPYAGMSAAANNSFMVGAMWQQQQSAMEHLQSQMDIVMAAPSDPT